MKTICSRVTLLFLLALIAIPEFAYAGDHSLMLATSPDGLTWTKTNRVIAPSAGSPGTLFDGQTIWLYYLCGSAGGAPTNGTLPSHLFVRKISPDLNTIGAAQTINISGRGMTDPQDPDVHLLPDGTYRMYYYESPPTGVDGLLRMDSEIFNIATAKSKDGINFVKEGTAFKYLKIMDPSVIQTPDGNWRMFNSYFEGLTRRTVTSVSTDGKNFVFDGMAKIANPVNAKSSLIQSVIPVPGGYRMYYNSPEMPPQIYSAFSTDGKTWTSDPGVRVKNAGSMAVSIVNGTYVMFYAGGPENETTLAALAGPSGPTGFDADLMPSISVLGYDNALYFRTMTGEFQNLGGYLTSPPKSIRDAKGNTYIFVRGGDNALWVRTPKTGWVSLGELLTSEPEPIMGADKVIYVFARGRFGGVLKYSLATGAWDHLGGFITSNPKPILGSDQSIYVFVRGGDYAAWYVSATTGAWYGLGGYLLGAPMPVIGQDKTIMVFARGGDSAVWYRSATSGGWSSLGGYIISNPVPILESDQKLHVYAQGGDSALWARALDSNWKSLEGSITTVPVLLAGPDGVTYIFARFTDGALYYRKSLDAPPGHGWNYLGGSILGPPSVVLGITP